MDDICCLRYKVLNCSTQPSTVSPVFGSNPGLTQRRYPNFDRRRECLETFPRTPMIGIFDWDRDSVRKRILALKISLSGLRIGDANTLEAIRDSHNDAIPISIVGGNAWETFPRTPMIGILDWDRDSVRKRILALKISLSGLRIGDANTKNRDLEAKNTKIANSESLELRGILLRIHSDQWIKCNGNKTAPEFKNVNHQMKRSCHLSTRRFMSDFCSNREIRDIGAARNVSKHAFRSLKLE